MSKQNYKILQYANFKELEREVNKKIDEGFSIASNTFCIHKDEHGITIYTQVMIRVSQEEEVGPGPFANESWRNYNE